MSLIRTQLTAIFIMFIMALLFLNLKNNEGTPNIPYNSFVHIRISVISGLYENEDFNNRQISGSGAVIKNDNFETLILTAEHVCNSSITASGLTEDHTIKFITITDWNGNMHDAEIIGADPINDLCMLKVHNTDIPSLKISRRQLIPGDRVYNMAAPYGIFGNKFILTFEGFYSGLINSENKQIYTIPAAPGSSGSPIINENGHLVGMIHSATESIENIAIGPKTSVILAFIEKYY